MGFLRGASMPPAAKPPAPSVESLGWAADRFDECLDYKLQTDGPRDWVWQAVNVGAMTESAESCWELAHGSVEMDTEWIVQCVERASARLDVPATSLGYARCVGDARIVQPVGPPGGARSSPHSFGQLQVHADCAAVVRSAYGHLRARRRIRCPATHSRLRLGDAVDRRMDLGSALPRSGATDLRSEGLRRHGPRGCRARRSGVWAANRRSRRFGATA